MHLTEKPRLQLPGVRRLTERLLGMRLVLNLFLLSTKTLTARLKSILIVKKMMKVIGPLQLMKTIFGVLRRSNLAERPIAMLMVTQKTKLFQSLKMPLMRTLMMK